MASQKLREKIGKVWQEDGNERKASNKVLSDLYEGKIRQYVKERINKEIKDAHEQWEVSNRILEIDIVKRIVKKLARAYRESPVRTLVNGNDNDKLMFDWYMQNTNIKDVFQHVDKNYNNFKEALVQCFFHIDSGLPYFKTWSPHQYIAVSDDNQDESNPTVYATQYAIDDKNQVILLCVSDTETWLQDLKGDVKLNPDNEFGLNEYGLSPFIYIKNTSTDVMPYPDDSMISVATLIPMLCGDINYAIKYMAYGIVYGINIKDDLIRRGPNAFWNLMPFDENSGIPPSIGTLKPDIDIKDVFDGIMMQLQLWLNARGISASIFGYGTSSIQSGVSKMIDESDVSAIIEENQQKYIDMEKELFNFVFHYGHEQWKTSNPEIPQGSFSPDCYVNTTFQKVDVIKTRSELVAEVKEELATGLLSKKRAVKRLNPNMSDDEVEELLIEIKEESAQSMLPAEKSSDQVSGQLE
jgi:hypothetical protein